MRKKERAGGKLCFEGQNRMDDIPRERERRRRGKKKIARRQFGGSCGDGT
jgi:hypothetical protein